MLVATVRNSLDLSDTTNLIYRSVYVVLLRGDVALPPLTGLEYWLVKFLLEHGNRGKQGVVLFVSWHCVDSFWNSRPSGRKFVYPRAFSAIRL